MGIETPKLPGSAVRLAPTIALIVACGGGGEQSDASGPDAAPRPDAAVAYVPLTDYPDALVGALCARATRCGVFARIEPCRDALGVHGLSFADVDGLLAVLEAVDRGDVDYDGEAAAACLGHRAEAACDPSAASVRAEPAACAALFRGAVADDSACTLHEQCSSGWCDGAGGCADACCAGTCRPRRPAPVGESCEANPCALGAFCQATTCVPLKGRGMLCVGDHECEFGLSCGVADQPGCQPAPGRGSSCFDATSCRAVGLACDPASGTCQPLLQRGASCDPANDRCSWHLRCDSELAVCTSLPAAGELCGGGPCAPGAICAAGVCTSLRPDGGPCSDRRDCLSEYCQAGTGTCEPFAACLDAQTR